jgi:hypothetical protein
MKKALLSLGLLVTLGVPSGLWAQQAGYSQTNLVSNVAGVATTTDSQLLNPWGISVLPGQDFWISDNSGYHSRSRKPTKSQQQLQPRLSYRNSGQCQRFLLLGRIVHL